jgi:hypothetical protein
VAGHASSYVLQCGQQPCDAAVAMHRMPCADGCAAVQGAHAAADAIWLAADASSSSCVHPAGCNPVCADLGHSGRPVCTASASTASLQDSAFEGPTGVSSSCTGPGSVVYSRSSSAGSSSAAPEAT